MQSSTGKTQSWTSSRVSPRFSRPGTQQTLMTSTPLTLGTVRRGGGGRQKSQVHFLQDTIGPSCSGAVELKLEPSQSSPRYSETSKQIYLIDVDQRTLFSLQAVINDSVMVILPMMTDQIIFMVIDGGMITFDGGFSTSTRRCLVRRASLSRCSPITSLSRLRTSVSSMVTNHVMSSHNSEQMSQRS